MDNTTSNLTPEEIIQRIKSTYDLKDLARRPILLNLIVKTIPELPRDKPIDAAIVYEVYTDFWLERDWGKGDKRHLVEKETRRRFTVELAWQMYTDDTLSIHHTNLSSKVEAAFTEYNENSEFFNTDIRTCTFLNRDSAGNFSFIHPSFMEFFVAVYSYAQLLLGKREALSTHFFTPEVTSFLAHMLGRNTTTINSFKNQLNDLNQKKLNDFDSKFVSNSIGLHSALGYNLKSKNFLGLRIMTCELAKIGIENVRFEQAEFSNCVFELKVAEKITFTQSIIVGSKFLATDFIHTTFDRVVSEDNNFSSISLSYSFVNEMKIISGHFSTTTLTNTIFVNTDFQDAIFENNITFNNCLIVGCSFNQCRGEITFQGCNIAYIYLEDSPYIERNLRKAQNLNEKFPSKENYSSAMAEAITNVKHTLREIDDSIRLIRTDLTNKLKANEEERRNLESKQVNNREREAELLRKLKGCKIRIGEIRTTLKPIIDELDKLKTEETSIKKEIEFEEKRMVGKSVPKETKRISVSRLEDARKRIGELTPQLQKVVLQEKELEKTLNEEKQIEESIKTQKKETQNMIRSCEKDLKHLNREQEKVENKLAIPDHDRRRAKLIAENLPAEKILLTLCKNIGAYSDKIKHLLTKDNKEFPSSLISLTVNVWEDIK